MEKFYITTLEIVDLFKKYRETLWQREKRKKKES